MKANWSAAFVVAVVVGAAPLAAQTPKSATTRPAQAAAGRPARAKADQPTTGSPLEKRLDRVDFDEIPLRDVISDLARQGKTNIVVRWSRLREVGVEPDQPVTLHVRDLKLGKVLWLVLWLVAGNEAELGFMVEDGLILVSTAADFDSQQIVRVYDVADLVMPRLKSIGFASMRARLIPVSAYPYVTSGAVAYQPITEPFGSGVYLGSRSPLYFNSTSDEYDGTAEEHMQKLIDLITTTVEPQSWAVNGGTGTIVAYRKKLVVRNSLRVHRLLAGTTLGQPAGKPSKPRTRAERP